MSGIILFFAPEKMIFSQGISISDSNTLPDPKAMLDIQSLTKGLLIPRLDLQSSNITTGLGVNQLGLLVFNTNQGYSLGSGFYFWTGIHWQKIYDGTDVPLNYWYNQGDSIYRLKRNGTEIYRIYQSDNLQTIGQGLNVLNSNTSGKWNYASGYNALSSNTTGISNTATGYYALNQNTTGQANTAVGLDALHNNTTGNDNSAFGSETLYQNTTGSDNSGMGMHNLSNNTTGSRNSAFGEGNLYNNSTGCDNVAGGLPALVYNTTGNYNVAIGNSSLFHNTTALYNTAVGQSTMYFNTTGIGNTTAGEGGLYNLATGNYNTGLGLDNLYYVTTGIGNSALGFNAGRSMITGHYNLFLGNGSGFNALQKNDAVNTVALGDSTYTTKDNQVVIGNSAITEVLINGITVKPGVTDSALISDHGVIKKQAIPSIPAQYWGKTGNQIYPLDTSDIIGIGFKNPSASLDIKYGTFRLRTPISAGDTGFGLFQIFSDGTTVLGTDNNYSGQSAGATTRFEIQTGSGYNSDMGIKVSSQNNDFAPMYYLLKSKGTLNNPLPVTYLSRLGGIIATGYNNNFYRTAAKIIFMTSASPIGDTVPTDIIFYNHGWGVASDGGFERMRIKDDGDIDIKKRLIIETIPIKPGPADSVLISDNGVIKKQRIGAGSLKVDSCAYFALKDHGNSGTSLTVDWNAGNMQKITRTGNCTVNMTAPPGATRLTLLVNHENSSVPYTLNFSPAPKWPGGVAPSFTNTASGVDIINFVFDGIAYYATVDNDFK